jgi:hypothetical protein
MDSFAVRCIFRWESRPEQRRKYLYEERITLWKASDIDEAIEKAEKEATEYARDGGHQFLDYSQAFWLYSEVDADGIEVFSLLRESDFENEKYIDAFFDTEMEHERT